MKTLLNAVCATALLSSTALAQTGEALPADLVVNYLESVGAEMRWDSRIEASGITVLKGVEIRRYGKLIKVDDLRTNGLQLTGVNFKASREAGGGVVSAGSLEMSDPRALMKIFSYVQAVPFPDDEEDTNLIASNIPDSHFGEECSVAAADGLSGYSWSAGNVRIVGDTNALPEVLSGPEEIRIQSIHEDLNFSMTDETCRSQESMQFNGVDVIAIDGARANILSGLSQTVFNESLSDESYEVQESLKLDRLTVSNSQGVISASADSLKYSRISDDDMNVLLCDILWPHADMSSTDMLLRALSTQSGGRIEVEGAWMSVPEFLPPYLIEAMGLQDSDEISGDVKLEGTLSNGLINTTSVISFPDLIQGELKAKFSLPETLDVKLPGFIAGKLPIPGELLDMKVHELSFSYIDQGIGEIVATTTGLSPAQHVSANLELLEVRLRSKLPEFIASKLNDARQVFVDVIEKGGSISVKPESAQTVMSIAMQGMMNPDGLTDNMGVQIQIKE